MFIDARLHNNLKQATREIYMALVRERHPFADRTYFNGNHDREIEDILDALVDDLEANIDFSAGDIEYDIDINEDEDGDGESEEYE